jgi:hypothetical protein
MWPIRLAFLLFIVCSALLSSLALCNTFHFLHERSKWSSPSFSSTAFQNFAGIPDLLSEVSKFQDHTKLCPKCSTLLVSSVNLNPICRWKESSSSMLLFFMQFWIQFHVYILYHSLSCYSNSWKYSTFSGCFWSIIICVRDGCLEILITKFFSTFIPIPQHIPISVSLLDICYRYKCFITANVFAIVDYLGVLYDAISITD